MHPANRTATALPAWPLYVLFVGFPAWWVAGLGSFAVALSAVPMLALLIQRGRVHLPPAFGLWLAFLVWSAACVVEIDDVSRLIGFVFRVANYVGSGVVFLYVFNARNKLGTRQVTGAMVFFFGFVVIGGYLGVVLPNGGFHTLTEAVLPSRLRANAYVQSLVQPSFAEVQHPYGSARTFSRPSAPFPYTNSWGCNIALLLPFVIAAASSAQRRTTRLLLFFLLAAALVPAFATLNRGMFLAVGMMLAYGALRLALRGRLVPLVSILTFTALGLVVAVQSGVTTSLAERLRYSQTNTSRSTIYRQAFDGALDSPLFGNGAPRPSNLLTVSIGTQGQVWNVMFSYGFVGLALFLGWFGLAAISSRHAGDAYTLWTHTAVVVACATFFFYGYDGPQLAVLMVACAVALRPVETSRALPAARVPQAV